MDISIDRLTPSAAARLEEAADGSAPLPWLVYFTSTGYRLVLDHPAPADEAPDLAEYIRAAAARGDRAINFGGQDTFTPFNLQ